MVGERDADVCVIGAGYAGLTAARRLVQHGRSVVVLEARDRVGGRIWTEQLPGGAAIDRGGAWLAPRHDAMFGLAREVGVTTYKTWVAGAHLLVDGDRLRRYTGVIPKISPLAVATIALAQLRIDRLSRGIDLEQPWASTRAAEWDGESVASYVRRLHIRSGIGAGLFEMAVRGLFASDLEDVSLLDLLMLVRGHGSINTLFSIEKGSQENMVDGGAGEIARRVAAELGDAVALSSPVRAIEQSADRVTVRTDDRQVAARRAIVTVPPALVCDIAFEPALPDDRRSFYEQSVAGWETKTLLVYDEAFWRGDGLSGQTAAPGSAAEVTLDASPASGAPGVLASFTFGPTARRLAEVDAGERRHAVLEALAARVGPRARDVREVVETSWFEEQWSRGCSMAHWGLGVLTRGGHLLREPWGLVHWAGTETSVVSHGAMDGAVRSGERAATEVLDRM